MKGTCIYTFLAWVIPILTPALHLSFAYLMGDVISASFDGPVVLPHEFTWPSMWRYPGTRGCPTSFVKCATLDVPLSFLSVRRCLVSEHWTASFIAIH